MTNVPFAIGPFAIRHSPLSRHYPQCVPYLSLRGITVGPPASATRAPALSSAGSPVIGPRGRLDRLNDLVAAIHARGGRALAVGAT